MKKAFYYFALLLMFNSCYISKNLDRVVNVTLDENFIINVSNTSVSNFTGGYSIEEYRKAFLEGMLGEFETAKIVISETNPEFAIQISGLSIEETSGEKKGEDGQTFIVTTLILNSEGNVTQINGGKLMKWNAEKIKTEKVTNSRSTSDVISGSNKDRMVSRKKPFTSSKAIYLAERCGRRAGARIVNDIVKTLKKG